MSTRQKSLFQFTMIIPLAVLLCFAFSCQKQAKEGITEEEAETIIEGFLKFRNEGDLVSADKVLHPECVIRYPNLPEAIVGLDAYKEYDKMTRIAFAGFKMTVDNFFVKDDKIISYWTLDATNTGSLMSLMGEIPPTNKKVHISGIAVSRVVDGKIIEDVAYFDMLDLMQQLGFTLTPPQPPELPEEKK